MVNRSKVFSHISKQKVDIVYLQETHLLPKDHCRLGRGGFSRIYHSKFASNKSRGTAILIHRDVFFEETKVIADKDGRFVIVQWRLFSVPVVLVSLYAPNWDDVKFFSDLFARLPDPNTHQLILGGDFNCVLHPVLDRSSSLPRALSKSANCVNNFMHAYGMVDAWRYMYSTTRKY